jgi:phosphoribosyl 1,2-cyclic phosphodiesterase
MFDSESKVLTVRFRGVRGSTPTPDRKMLRYGGNTSCVEVRFGNQLLILDAGTGIRNLGIDLAAEFAERPIEAHLLLSHTHWDHIQGLPFFAPAYQAHHRFTIVGSAGTRARLEQALRSQMDSMYFPVSFDAMPGIAAVTELSPEGGQLGNLSIRAISLNHPGGCAGFRIEANGTSVAYLPDHEPYRDQQGQCAGVDKARWEALAGFLRGVNLLILDTQYTEQEYARHRGWGHGCLPDSVALALEAQVARLAFFHHDPSHTDGQIDEMLKTARQIAGAAAPGIEAARELQTIVMSPPVTGQVLSQGTRKWPIGALAPKAASEASDMLEIR